MNAKQEALNRTAKKREQIQELMRDRTKEMQDRADAMRHTASTPGWQMIVSDLERVIPYLNEVIAETSPYRIFRQIELRSQKKAFEKLYKLLKTHELASVLSHLKDQAEA